MAAGTSARSRPTNGNRATRAAERDLSVPERLIAAASRLFAEKGYESTSVQEVVMAAGVTKGAMYHYFGSKDDLLYEIYHRVLVMQTERLETFARGEGPIEERLRAAAIDVVVTSTQNLDDLTVFFRSMHMLEPAKQRAIRTERRRYHERFRAMVEEGQRAGVFRDDVSADLAVHYFFGALHHLPTWFRASGRMAGRDVGAAFVDLLFRGLLAATPPAARRSARRG